MTRKPRDKVTIKDVAQAAGVSAMTVSNVINGRIGLVSERTRIQVEREITRLNYKLRIDASGLRTGSSRTIGIVLIGDDLTNLSPSPGADLMLRSFSKTVSSSGYLTAFQANNANSLEAAIKSIKVEVEAFCILFVGQPANLTKAGAFLASQGRPTLELGSRLLPGTTDLCHIGDGGLQSGKYLADALFERKIKHCILIGVPPSHISERTQGVETYLRLHGVETTRLTRMQTQDVLAISRDYLEEAVGLVAATKDQLISILLSLRSAGASSATFQIACLDWTEDLPQEDSGSGSIGLTANYVRMGKLAAEVLLARLTRGSFEFNSLELPCAITTR
jgi:DNA-binding LacI/PurR family transcriptional regulator